MTLTTFQSRFWFGLAPEGLKPPAGFEFVQSKNTFLQVKLIDGDGHALVELDQDATKVERLVSFRALREIREVMNGKKVSTKSREVLP